MSVISELLLWSRKRPAWQRDALRRLIVDGDPKQHDIDDLVTICKSTAEGSSESQFDPLDRRHLPLTDEPMQSTSLIRLTHNHGVNALAPQQSIDFGKNLSIVYGQNAAGKSGYSRILRKACHARAHGEILTNVFDASSNGEYSATIQMKCGDHSSEVEVTNSTEHTGSPLGGVSVFDSDCSAVYLSSETNVAFRPFGLDLFDKLVRLCEVVRQRIQTELDAVDAKPVAIPKLPEGTEAFKRVTSLTHRSSIEEIRRFARLSEDEQFRIQNLESLLSDQQSKDPKKLAQALDLQLSEASALVAHLRRVHLKIGASSMMELADCRRRVSDARNFAHDNVQTLNASAQLSGTGSDLWRTMWEAAREFSVTHAYPHEHFPYLDAGARCVICQQHLDDAANDRLRSFENYSQSLAQRSLEQAQSQLQGTTAELRDLEVFSPHIAGIVNTLAIDQEELAGVVEHWLRIAEFKRILSLNPISFTRALNVSIRSISPPPIDDLTRFIASLRERLSRLKDPTDEDVPDLMQELIQLQARSLLFTQIASIEEEIKRLVQVDLLKKSIRDTITTGITRKGTDLTQAYVSDTLIGTFDKELKQLSGGRILAYLKGIKGSYGSFYHKLLLRNADSADVRSVVSEGEARILSLAAFFAELSTAESKSAVILDDPVSSLDHIWRDTVAERLVQEAHHRQVIVFTHDIVFLNRLVSIADEYGMTPKTLRVERDSKGFGVSINELPWGAMKTRERIGRIKDLHQSASKLFRENRATEYYDITQRIFGLLRETWERAIEEVLLNGAVERFRISIETRRLQKLTKFTPEDYEALDKGMSECSRWLVGHDSPSADNSSVPEPERVLTEITRIEEWVATIRNRQK